MKNIWNKLWARKWLVALAIVAILGILFFSGNNGENSKQTTVAATKGNLTQIVTVTGKTKPAEEVSLAFERSGRVSRIKANVGDHVKAGETLIQLETSELSAQLQQAEATYASQKARLDQIEKGTREEQLQITRNGVDKAKQDLLNTYDDIANIAQDTYFKTEDAVRKQTDDMFINDDQPTAQLSFTTGNSFAKFGSEKDRAILSAGLISWKTEIDALIAQPTPDYASADVWMQKNKDMLSLSKKNVSTAISLLNSLTDAVSDSLSLSPTTIATYRTNLNAAKTSLSATLTSISNQEQAISSSAIALELAERQLRLQLAGSTPEEIAAQRAQLQQAEASISGIQAQLSKAFLRSPINGVVTKMDTKVGQITSPNVPIISIISDGQMQIEANVPEVDIGRVSTGQIVQITLDAYGEDKKIEGTVQSIEPGETIIEGVATYKTKISVAENKLDIKSGMTANLEILTDKKDNVLVVPQRSVITENGEKYVLMYMGENPAEKRTVTTGLKGSDGNIEIVSGLAEGDLVLNSPE